MLKTLRITLSLKNTYRVNSILYSLKQIPLLRRCLPSYLYRIRSLKIFANVLSVFWEIVSVFLWKILYFLTMICGLELLYKRIAPELLFVHILLFLTLIGSYMNTNLFTPSRDKYYAIVLLRMDARSFTLVHFGYALLKTAIGFLPLTLLFGLARDVPLWLCVLIPFCVVGAKLAVTAWSLRDYEKDGRVRNDSKLQGLAWILTGALLLLAYVPPVFGLVLPFAAAAVLWLIWIPLGLIGLRRILLFSHYSELCKELLSPLPLALENTKKAAKIANEKMISADTAISSRKKGVEYLNELFVKRHRKILWRSTIRIACICAILCCGTLFAITLRPELKADVNEMIMTWLPYFAFVMYLINRGTNFTSALFMNCDHSLLTYSFFKQPKFVLQLFWVRLREITKVNSVPAVVIGVGLCLILWASGGTDNVLNYALLLVSIVCMSLFFSIHYLTVYYLLQPYTAGTEIRSGTYRIVMMMTYLACYALMNLRLPILVFGAACIVFCVLYSVVASVLVYRFAPRTFRLRT